MLYSDLFLKHYSPNDSFYLGLNSEAKNEFVKNHFRDFANENGVDFKILSSKLIEYSNCTQKNKPNSLHKAVDLFKTHFAFPFKCISPSCIYGDVFEEIKNNYGVNIVAHGVEEAKGGCNNILLMWVTGKVVAPAIYWGALVDGLPNISPISHGPYYLISSISGGNAPNNPSPNEVLYVLVPFEEVKAMLKEKIDSLQENKLLSSEVAENLISKVITYGEFLDILNLKFKKSKTVEFCGKRKKFDDADHGSDSESDIQPRKKFMPTNGAI
ncbi:MAG: hypothetical protein U1E78_06525 [Gammaproteobacteria bacterium]